MTNLMKNIKEEMEKIEHVDIDLSDKDEAINIIIDHIHGTFKNLAVMNANLYFYTGTHYEKLEDEHQEKSFFLKGYLQKLIGKRHIRKNLINLIHSELLNDYHLPIKPEGFINLVNLKNGVLGLSEENIEFIEHNPSYGFRYVVPYEYDENAQAPLFEKFLLETVESKESIKFIYEYMGYILLANHLSIETTLFLLGEGRNGKSVLVSIFSKLVGEDNTSYVELQDLKDPNKISLVDGKLLNVGTDSSDKNFDTSQFKRLVSREPILARQLYKDAYIMKDIPISIFAMNNLPFSQGDTSFGLLRRLKIIQFNKIIAEDKVDRDLPQKLETELAGILNLAIDGAIRLIQNGRFTDSKEITKAIKNYEDDINMVKRFIDDFEIIEDKDNRISNQQIYTLFSGWCKDEGIRTPAKRYLIKKLRNLGFQQYKNNSVRGFKIKTSQSIIIPIPDNEKDDEYYKKHPYEFKLDRKI